MFGNSILLWFVIHPLSVSVLKILGRPNHCSSIRLFCLLHTHEGVKTSALSLLREFCISFALAERGLIIPSNLSVIRDTSIVS